jgi:hypothetical protein
VSAQNSGDTAKPRGRPFKPGESGNPGGRPKADPALALAFRQYAPEALQVLVTLMRRRARPALQLRAAMEILARGFDPQAAADESLRSDVESRLDKLQQQFTSEEFERIFAICSLGARASGRKKR